MAKEKLKRYQQQLLDLLVDGGWELVSIDEAAEGWFYGHWTLRSVQEKWGHELIISFFEAPNYWWGITASTRRPHGREDESVFARMELGSGRYDEAVTAFVREIDDHRRSIP